MAAAASARGMLGRGPLSAGAGAKAAGADASSAGLVRFASYSLAAADIFWKEPLSTLPSFATLSQTVPSQSLLQTAPPASSSMLHHCALSPPFRRMN